MKNNNTILFLLGKISLPRKLITVSILIISAGSITGLVIPLFTGKAVDNFSADNISPIFFLIFLIAFLSNAILSGLGIYLMSKIGEKIIFSIREMLWNHIISLKVSFFDKNESGELISRITDDTKIINSFVAEKFPNVFPYIITLIGSIVILFILDWKITLISLVSLPVYILIMIPLGKIVKRISNETQNEIAHFTGLLGRVLSEIRLVKLSTAEDKEIKNAKENLFEIYLLGLKDAKIFSIIQPLSSIFTLLTIGIILAVGGLRVSDGTITAGTLVSMIFYVIQLSVPLINISTLFTDYQKAIGASRRIKEILLEQPEEQNNKENNSVLSFKNGDIHFKNVIFKYSQKDILKSLNFTIEKGTTTAIVGPSGSGKTTILNLIARLYENIEGEILINSTNIHDISLKQWRGNIGYASQNNPMINGTIRDNLLYSTNEEFTDAELIKYSKLANCHSFIENLELGYDSIVGERGLKLSGGQKQRINIARNFIKNPQVLLLDEATASLDSESEKEIQKSLDGLINGRTTIIVAHRLSTIKEADKILFLDQGEITGEGSHEMLMKEHEKYKRFVETQKL
ncbi:ABC transporter ATP-binding protein [Lysinibacillus sp. NPDC058147]|uniref:ABC transporter ATP-binding protein n=1 Tax=unclassified Lysinibacillus TaxID=2636778 RepID=UPI0036D8C1B6